jgi:hypothetical protein
MHVLRSKRWKEKKEHGGEEGTSGKPTSEEDVEASSLLIIYWRAVEEA